jgi:hypothetical protein
MPTEKINMPSELLKEVINPWLLGADPEWAVMTPPDKVVPNSGQMAVNTNGPAGAIGADHNGRVWELRPSPSPSAYVVATNLWKLLRQEELEKVAKFKWKSGALGAKKHQTSPGTPTTLAGWVQHYNNPMYGFGPGGAQQAAQQAFAQQQAQEAMEGGLDTLGGHVHFGISQLNKDQRVGLNAVTTGMLNLDILPQKENSKRLAITNNSHLKYGHFEGGDAVRDCNGHVEYRCAPSWLDKPGQALAALTIYKIAGARPSSVEWPAQKGLKQGLLDWLEHFASDDVDAFILLNFIDRQGFDSIQADPSEDFKTRWRRDNPWERL